LVGVKVELTRDNSTRVVTQRHIYVADGGNCGQLATTHSDASATILLVDFTNQLRQRGTSLDDAVQEAGEVRFLPILLTSATAIGGLLPLAIVIIGGLITSTLLARLVTPVMYKLLPPSVQAMRPLPTAAAAQTI
jgi:Cu/Ag efflux pump CusA